MYDVSKPNGSRVKTLDGLCSKCRVPQYVPLNDAEIYKVAIPTLTAGGGDGYHMIKDNLIAHHLSGTFKVTNKFSFVELKLIDLQ